MGWFKDENPENPIVKWLIERGFEKGKGPHGERGYVLHRKTSAGNYMWLTIDLEERKVYHFVETEDSSPIINTDFDIEGKWLEDLHTFINEIDERV